LTVKLGKIESAPYTPYRVLSTERWQGFGNPARLPNGFESINFFLLGGDPRCGNRLSPCCQ
jgi:hypothetical protein